MIQEILVRKEIIAYMTSRKLLNQFKKAENYLLSWNYKLLDFKLRQPKQDKIYYFRLNKQYRLWWKLEGDVLKIFHIDNHSR